MRDNYKASDNTIGGFWVKYPEHNKAIEYEDGSLAMFQDLKKVAFYQDGHEYTYHLVDAESGYRFENNETENSRVNEIVNRLINGAKQQALETKGSKGIYAEIEL